MIYVRDVVEANLLEAVLASEGIPHYIKAYRDPAYRGIWTFNDAYGQVECPPAHRRRVAEILQAIRRRDG